MAGKTEEPQVDLDNLSEEEAEKLLAEAEAADSEGGKEESEEETAEATTDDSEKDEDGGDEAEEDGQQEEDTDKAEEGEEKRDPLKDTQRAFHEKARALKEAELENQRLKAELDALKTGANGKKYGDGLTDQELEDLQYEDPAKWREIMNARDKADAEREAAQQEHAQVGEQITAQRQLLHTLNFAQQVLGVDMRSVADPFNPDNVPDQVKEFLQSQEFQRLEQEVVENFKPGADGIYTMDQMLKAHRLINWDKFAAEQRQAGASQSLTAIQKAAQTGSKLDTAPKGDGAKSMRSLEKLTQEDIMAMGAGELESYYKELGLEE